MGSLAGCRFFDFYPVHLVKNLEKINVFRCIFLLLVVY